MMVQFLVKACLPLGEKNSYKPRKPFKSNLKLDLFDSSKLKVLGKCQFPLRWSQWPSLPKSPPDLT